MPHNDFVRLPSAERRIARQALLDAVLSQDFEQCALTCSTSAAQDTPEAAHNENQSEEVLAGKIIHQSMRNLSFIFQSDELSDILTASAAPPPPLRRCGRGTATVSRVCSWEQETEALPDARVAWGTLAQRFKLAVPAPLSHTPTDESDASFSAFCQVTSAADTFSRRQSMSARRKSALADLHLRAC